MKKQYIINILLLMLVAINAHSGTIWNNLSKEKNLRTGGLSISWAGITNTSWTTSSNWSGGIVPTINDDVRIPAGTPFSLIISNGVIGWCNSLEVNSGANFTIAPGGILHITNARPELITAIPVTGISVKFGGTIIDTGSCALTAHGIVISTAPDPTINDINYPDESGTVTDSGSFSIDVNTLSPDSTYYVRAYATNCKGTNYGNEVIFPDDAETGYFKLITGGVTYFSYDLSDPLAAKIFPQGDTRFALITVDPASKVFSVASQSSFILNPGASFGYNFSYINPEVTDTGTYIFGRYNAEFNNDITIAIRTGPGDPQPQTSANYNVYQNIGIFARHLTNLDCEATELSSGLNTLVITKWGKPGEFIEGTIKGILYENAKSSFKCLNSTDKPFSVKFKLKRLQ